MIYNLQQSEQSTQKKSNHRTNVLGQQVDRTKCPESGMMVQVFTNVELAVKSVGQYQQQTLQCLTLLGPQLDFSGYAKPR